MKPNEDIAGRLEEVPRILADQGAGRFRAQACHQSAAVLRRLARPVFEISTGEGLAGWQKLHRVGRSIARASGNPLGYSRLAVFERLFELQIACGRGSNPAPSFSNARAHNHPRKVFTSGFGGLNAPHIARGSEDECEDHQVGVAVGGAAG